MAKKEIQELSPVLVKKLKSLNIDATTESDARKILLEGLKKFDVDEVDEDPIEDLINIYEAFVEIEGGPEKESNEPEDDESEESEEEEVPAPKKTKKTKKAKSVKLEEEQQPSSKHEDEEAEEAPIKKEKVSKTSKKKSSSRSRNSERFDGSNKNHIKIVKEAFQFVEGFDLKMEFKKTYVKFVLNNSVSSRRVIQCEKISLEDGKIKSLFIVFFSLNLVDGDKIEILEEMVAEDLYETMSVVQHCDAVQIKVIGDTGFKKILNKKNVKVLTEAIQTLDKRMQKRHDKMVQEFDNDEE